jgi:hypothetical protein
MKTHQKFLHVLMGALIVGTGSAQTWTVNGAANPSGTQLTTSSTQSAMTIDPVSALLNLNTIGGGGTPTVAISAVPNPVNVNAQVSVTYSTAGFPAGSVSCTGNSTPSIGGWSGALGSSPVALTMPATQGPVTLNITCTGSGGGSANNFVAVQVNAINTNCTGITPNILGVARTLDLRNFSTFTGDATPFPAFGQTLAIGSSDGIDEGTVRAYEFVMPATIPGEFDGSFSLGYNPSSSDVNPSTAQAAVSLNLCAGVIPGNTPPRLCSSFGGNKAGVGWTKNNSFSNSPQRCLLVPGQTYFLNLGWKNCKTFGGSPGFCGIRGPSRAEQ